MSKRHWIAGATKNKGALHRNLGIPQGQRIPAATLASAARRGGTVGSEARLAETLRGFADGGTVSGPSAMAHSRFKEACKGR